MTSTLRKCLLAALCLFPFAAWADSECDGIDNLIANCGWEGNCWGGWHPTAPIIDVGRDGTAHSGDYYGILYPHSGLEGAEQEDLNTAVGQSYTLSFWVRNAEPIERLQVTWYSMYTQEQVVLDLADVPPQDWTQFVVPDLVAVSDAMRVYWAFANATGEVDIDDVVLVANE